MLIQNICKVCGTKFTTHSCYSKRGGGKYCSHKCYAISKRKNKVIEFGGDVFYKNIHGYYHSEKTGELYHRFIWKLKYGPIPENCHIHHKDENKENNSIENLIMLSQTKHHQLHYNNLLNHQKSQPINYCKVHGCEKRVKGYGLCNNHYSRAARVAKRGFTFEEAAKLIIDNKPYTRFKISAVGQSC